MNYKTQEFRRIYIIDRITNMTSACGVIKEISSHKENKADNIALNLMITR